jgi:tetratricopeptide (TPR) repeat protein
MWGYYGFWLLASGALALALAHPVVLGLAVLAVFTRRWLPDPVLYLKHAARVRSLRTAVELNPANATARAQLAEIWLDKRRPGRAIPLLVQALERDASSAELHYLLGLAHLRAGQPDAALEPLAAALARDARVRYGSAYLAIGDALARVGRLDEATDALARYLKINTSSLEGYYRLVKAKQRQGDATGARAARQEGLSTYRVLPAFQRRKQLLWWLALRI